MLTFLPQNLIRAQLMESWRKNFNVEHYALPSETFTSEYNFYKSQVYSKDSDRLKDKLYAVYNEETLVGYVVLNYCMCNNLKTLVINHIVVNPDFFNLGYGRQILKQIIKRETEDCVQIEAMIDDSNEIAINLFKSLGFIHYDSFDNVGYYKLVL